MVNAKKEKNVVISKGEYVRLNFFSLGNFRQMKTPFGFVDETGLLNSKTDPYFAIGLLKTQRAPTLYPKFRSLRAKLNCYPELKFNGLTNFLLPLAKGFIDVLFDSPVSTFSCVIIPKHDEDFDPETYFNNDIFEIYRKFFIVLIKENIGPIEILTILADDYFSPYDERTLDTFEGSIRAIVNSHFDRLALTGICQIRSNSNDFLQITDLLLGCVSLDLKIQKDLIDLAVLSTTKTVQIELLNHVKSRLGISPDGSFFLHQGLFVKSFHKSKPSFRITLFDPKKAVHIITQKSEPSSI
ncbi:MAG: DUF3800 domain-containing protein [Candidatus Gracilibacteria bacterium]